MYSEDELLLLSGLQHFAFCKRQWALIHIEQQWEENRLTADGRVLHERAHQQTEELRNDLLIVRSLPLHSFRLGLSGQADVVEFLRVSEIQASNGTRLEGRTGWWSPQPIEYKRGRAKREVCDRVQLCAQALCLEEMFGVNIAEGALFYGTNKRRTAVRFSAELRHQTENFAARMHELFKLGETPLAVPFAGCRSCSLKERCLPECMGKRMPVSSYYRGCLGKD